MCRRGGVERVGVERVGHVDFSASGKRRQEEARRRAPSFGLLLVLSLVLSRPGAGARVRVARGVRANFCAAARAKP